MKINAQSKNNSIQPNIRLDGKKVEGSMQSSFSSHMSKSSGQAQDEMLYNMAQDIIKQGERLSEKIDISELKAYKRMVAEFIEEAVKGSNKFSKESFLDRRGRHRVYALVKKVNQQIDDLTKEVISSEVDNLRIISKIEDIRGLILDIIL